MQERELMMTSESKSGGERAGDGGGVPGGVGEPQEGGKRRKTVCVLGAGVGGLAAAHHLALEAKRRGGDGGLPLDVVLVERNPEAGGQARSAWTPEGRHSEYCWHVVGKGYVHLAPLLESIPAPAPAAAEGGDGGDDGGEGEGTTGTTRTTRTVVRDRLRPLNRFLYGRHDDVHWKDERGSSFVASVRPFSFLRGIRELGGRLTLKDLCILGWLHAYMQTSCPERQEQLDELGWRALLSGLSEEARKWVVDTPSIYLGMDTSRLSTAVLFNMFRPSVTVPSLASHDFWSFDAPINDAWFDPWVRHLREDLGVRVALGASVERVEPAAGEEANGKWDVTFRSEGAQETRRCDAVVNALGAEQAAVLLPGAAAGGHLPLLAEHGRQVQTQVAFYLTERVDWQEPSIVILPDTPWCIMIRPEGPLWRVPVDRRTDRGGEDAPEDVDVLAAGIGIWDRPGPLHGKPAERCTRDEIAEEVWHQIHLSKRLMREIGMPAEHSGADVWHSFAFDEANGEMDTWEPKWSNSTGLLRRRPRADRADPGVSPHRLYHATAYARTDASIFNMESAAEAGDKAAHACLRDLFPEARPRLADPAEEPSRRWTSGGWFSEMLKRFDKWLFDRGLDHPLHAFAS